MKSLTEIEKLDPLPSLHPLTEILSYLTRLPICEDMLAVSDDCVVL